MNISKIRLPFILFGMSMALFSCGGGDDDGDNSGAKPSEVNVNRNSVYADVAATRAEVPHLQGGNSEFIVYRVNDISFDTDRVNFCVEWDKTLKSNRWTCYILTKKNLKKNTTRWSPSAGERQYPFDTQNLTMNDYFTKSDNEDCYSRSGFDHGHLCPSNDRLYSKDVNKQTFYMTNMQPQYAVFNGSSKEHQYSGLWINMENFVYSIASGNKFGANDTLFICKGGTIDQESQILMRVDNKMIVPRYFYSAVVWKHASTGNYSGLAFWFEHTNVYHGNDKLKNYAISIDELETKLGGKIDFFCNLPDNVENKVEKTAATLDFGL